VFCPYVPPGKFCEALRTCPDWPKAKAIFCHQEFKNAKIGSIISRDGDEWPESYPFVITGHIHDYNRMQSNILCIGAANSVRHGESIDKTVSVFDIGAEILETRIDLGLPKKITYEISASEFDAFVLPENADVRLSILGTTEELEKVKLSDRYDVLRQKIKIICKPSNPKGVVRNIKNKTYMELLRDAVEHESFYVQQRLQEIIE
jgi:hypothetical protein